MKFTHELMLQARVSLHMSQVAHQDAKIAQLWQKRTEETATSEAGLELQNNTDENIGQLRAALLNQGADIKSRWVYSIRTDRGKPEKSWNLIILFSRARFSNVPKSFLTRKAIAKS